jgi:hypothetical protein
VAGTRALGTAEDGDGAGGSGGRSHAREREVREEQARRHGSTL